MTNKCEFCNERIEEDGRGKILGTIIKVMNEEGRNDKKYFCKNCQKEGREKDLIKKK